MTPRFYAPEAALPGDLVALPAEEAEHLARVLRLGVGDLVRVFNGRGEEFESVVEASTKDGVRVRVGLPCDPAPEARLAVTLAQAVLKGDKMDDVVRDAVMIGVVAVQPVVARHSEVSAATLEKARRRERWERIAASSAKQCGRAIVPPVLDAIPLEALTQKLSDSWLAGPSLMLVEPSASRTAVPLRELDVDTPKAATLVAGPEGGWAPEEIEAASQVCRLVTLGERTLRADAMALVAIAAVFAKWGEF